MTLVLTFAFTTGLFFVLWLKEKSDAMFYRNMAKEWEAQASIWRRMAKETLEDFKALRRAMEAMGEEWKDG